ncbi:hypothetical protein EKO03_15900 [Enterobacter quasiroggenkampii]|nr:hypothetical protein EKO03_15900 [Enterobacter quasiroggenkampii]
MVSADVSIVIKHYAAKARLEPNHKIDSARLFHSLINFTHQNNCWFKYQTLRGEAMPGGVKV